MFILWFLAIFPCRRNEDPAELKLLFDPNLQRISGFDGEQQIETNTMFPSFLKMTLTCFVQIMARGRFLFLCHLKVAQELISQTWRTNTSNYDAERKPFFFFWTFLIVLL